MNAKKSRLQRKFVNQMRGMAEIPWPARRYRYPATSGPMLTNWRCPTVVGIRRSRRPGWRGLIDLLLFRRPVVSPVICGAPLVLHPWDGRRRRARVRPLRPAQEAPEATSRPLTFTPLGLQQARAVALRTRMFQTQLLPWECVSHDPVQISALGRAWTACRDCGFMLEPDDRELLLRLLRGTG